MTNPITVTLNGLPCIAATCTMRTGARASTALCLIRTIDAPAMGQAAGPATLILSDGATNAAIRSLIVRSITSRADGVSVVRLADRRADWSARATIDTDEAPAGDIIASLLATLAEPSALHSLQRGHETIGALRILDAPAALALETVLVRIGQSFTIDYTGTLRAVAADQPIPDSPLLMQYSREPARRPAWLRIQSGSGVTAQALTFTGVPICRDESGHYHDLTTLTAAWGISDSVLAKAVFVPGAIARIVDETGATEDEKSIRTSLLAAHAWRSYRIPDSMRHHLPLIAARAGTSAATQPPLVEHTGFRHDTSLSATLDDPFEPSTPLTPHQGGFTFDGSAGTITFDRVVAELEPITPPAHHPTLEGRNIAAPPTIRITAGRSTNTARTLVTRRIGSGGNETNSTASLTLGHLAPPETQSASDPAIIEANRTASRIRRALPAHTTRATYAGAHAITPPANATVRIHASARSGLTTTVRPDANTVTRILQAFSTPTTPPARHITVPTAQTHPNPAPVTRARLGPVIIAESAADPPTGAALAFARAAYIDPDTGGLTLDQLGRLTTPFYLPNSNPDQPGRWCLGVPVRRTATGELLLDDASTTSTDHAAVSATPLGRSRPIPEGTEGILLTGADGETRLALFDRALVAQSRGTTPGAYTTEIREITGTALDETRRGPMHLIMVMALSPLHAAGGVGGAAAQRGWIPVLNLRDFSTGTGYEALLAGRGLFADDDGRSLGRLAHAPNQGGPVFSDAPNCEKHQFGEITHDGETFIESAGHLSTDAFFKMPGDAFYDAPFLFQAEETFSGPATGIEYQAEIKLNNDHTHPFNGTTKPGRWVVTYKLPFYDTPPPPEETWPPTEDPPVVVPRNIVAPSYDWSPPGGDPSSGPGAPPEGEEDVPYLGETVSSVGYAPIAGAGHPDPTLGGGVFFLPKGVRLVDGAPWAYEGPQYWVTLHPSVGLAFGKPNYADVECTPAGGFRAVINGSDELEVTGVDDDGNADLGKAVTVSAALNTAGTTQLATAEGAELGFFAQGPVARPLVEGATGGIDALTNLLAALHSLGLIEDATAS